MDIMVRALARRTLAALLAVSLACAGVALAPALTSLCGGTNGKAYAATPKLSAKKKAVIAGKTITLKVKNAGKKKIVWKSSNKKIATVSQKGKVKGKRAGACTITAKVGKKTLKCKVTVKAALSRTNATIVKGKTLTLKVRGLSGKVKWTSSNKKVATVSSKGKVAAKKVGKATIKAKIGKKTFKCKVTVVESLPTTSKNPEANPSNPPTPSNPAYKNPTTTSEKAFVQQVAGYTYKVTPVNGKLNNIVFVETNNPDPASFQLADESSKYLDKGEIALFKPLSRTYADVRYTNASTRRIADKGYLFYCYECDSDGGALKVLANKGYYYQSTSWGATYNDGVNYDTGKTVSVSALEDRADYLIRAYAAGKSSFFDKLNAVQSGLNSIALYPKRLLDTSKPNESAYPTLATSPYWELGLNKHVESMYQTAGDGLFLDAAYGFVLDSLGTPGMMGSVAKRLEPSCTVASASTHAYVDITYQGKTQTYGGAGTGTTYPLYSKFVNWKFTFDGSDVGYGTAPSPDTMRTVRLNCAKSSDELASEYLDQISMKSVTKVVGQGSWIRCAVEGWGGGKTLCYVSMGPDGCVAPVSEGWVDGRYVSINERYVPGAKFTDYPTADIVLSDITYAKKNGSTVSGAVTYTYYKETDDWRAPYYYSGSYWCSVSDIDNLAKLSPSLVLSRAQVNAMAAEGKIDGKTDVSPTKGYIYDGTAGREPIATI